MEDCSSSRQILMNLSSTSLWELLLNHILWSFPSFFKDCKVNLSDHAGEGVSHELQNHIISRKVVILRLDSTSRAHVWSPISNLCNNDFSGQEVPLEVRRFEHAFILEYISIVYKRFYMVENWRRPANTSFSCFLSRMDEWMAVPMAWERLSAMQRLFE